MFDDFEFGILNDPFYTEDAVREDLISPLLKALGYMPTGEQRMQRSQPLTHPFIMIGSQKRSVTVIPDYTLWYKEKVVLVLDAKRPSESAVKPEHVQQAFSYAIHPQIRSRSFALCNGHEFALFDVDHRESIFRVNLRGIGNHWPDVLKHLSPKALLDRSHREFLPDLGLLLRNVGVAQSCPVTFVNVNITSLGRLEDGLLTATASIGMDGRPYQGSFDVPMEGLPKLISCLPPQARSMVEKAIASEAGRLIFVDGMIQASFMVLLGEEVTGLYEHDRMVALKVQAINEVSLQPAMSKIPEGILPGDLVLPTIIQYL